MKILKSSDADIGVLDGTRVVVMGYGNQGRPQALNLRDSGIDVSVAARPGGNGWDRAIEDGFAPLSIEDGAETADVLIYLLPDEVQGRLFDEVVSDRLRPGAAICFAHGFAVAFGKIETTDHDVILVAPKGQGESVRSSYLEGSGLPGLIGVENDVSGNAWDIALAVAAGLGCLRIGGFRTSFREEAVSDIFGEQAVLCGGVPALVKKAWELLVRKGFSPEVAYFECVQELKIIVDLITEKGFSGMREMISGTAAYGGLKYGESIITPETEEAMERLFEGIDRGDFARDWLKTSSSDRGELETFLRSENGSEIEKTGRTVRNLYGKGEDNEPAEE
ncbi:MAG: ketol-acid reductoisomerase [Candidatus Krumholzibacteria bacterium]|nr:ketol-acid reductoisomerase [Candidatus Krumholzibacteria bacterium]